MVGKTISHYKVVEKIGQGGMGEVYLAEDSRLEVAVSDSLAGIRRGNWGRLQSGKPLNQGVLEAKNLGE